MLFTNIDTKQSFFTLDIYFFYLVYAYLFIFVFFDLKFVFLFCRIQSQRILLWN